MSICPSNKRSLGKILFSWLLLKIKVISLFLQIFYLNYLITNDSILSFIYSEEREAGAKIAGEYLDTDPTYRYKY